MLRRLLTTILILCAAMLMTTKTLAQAYSFTVPQITVDAYWNDDGSLSLDYTFVFSNNPGGHTIDFVDLGLPNSDYDLSSITAFVNGHQVKYFSSSEFTGIGSYGIAIGLEPYDIKPGTTGTVQISVGRITNVLYKATEGENNASAVFKPAYFSTQTSSGVTDYTMTFHLPPDVGIDESIYYNAPSGFPEQPESGFDEQGRIYYRWHNPNAKPNVQYEFGSAFPNSYVPSSSIVSENVLSKINFDFLLVFACIAIIALIIGLSIWSASRRKMQYLPPKVTIEGHGIKRGLTAVEASILLEEPLDKVLTMILFSVIKKQAAEVIKRDPLEIKVYQPISDTLHPYEKEFLLAFKENAKDRQKYLRDAIISLVREVGEKMKGFSWRDSIAYYREITKRAWEQVEEADTPEVKSQKFDEVMEWTMLDRNYDDRTRDIFRNQPVFIPTWWGRFDPGSGQSSIPKVSAAPTSSPRIPGSDFAASVVNSVQSFSSKVVGNITEFTSKVTSITNPEPISTSSSSSSSRSRSRSGGGCACACACACAGCACACAGGGR